MSDEMELKLLQEIENLKREIQLIKGEKEDSIPSFQYSKIRDKDLESIVDIEKTLDQNVFDTWFNAPATVAESLTPFFTELIESNKLLIDDYSEEDLKVNFIIPVLNKIKFKSFDKEVRDFYELPLTYKTDKFILNGTADFVVSTGLVKSKRPYFFIQEFKKSEEFGNPRPQLLAELISAVELNKCESMRGAYIIGASWHFVVLTKTAKDSYKYSVSQNYDSLKIDDLTAIFKNLLVIKNEIIATI